MANEEARKPDSRGLVFTAHNNHTPQCGLPPRVCNTDNRGLYYGYFENCHGEQFVFVFDRATKTGTISGGDLGWGNPQDVHCRAGGGGTPLHPKACQTDQASRERRDTTLAHHRRRDGAGPPYRADR